MRKTAVFAMFAICSFSPHALVDMPAGIAMKPEVRGLADSVQDCRACSSGFDAFSTKRLSSAASRAEARTGGS